MSKKKITDLVAGLAAVALAAVALLLWQQSQSVATAVEHESPEPEGRVVAIMQKMEIQVERLYYSGRDQEWGRAEKALADVSATAARLYDKDIHYGEINMSDAAEAVLPAELGRLGAVVHRRDRAEFLAQYSRMIQTCNACHRATGQLAVVQVPPPRRRDDLL